uniref:Uncharacterized protein n=1 Tax=Trepomonas sp. PC1 TaxID=1076344 RepID=A0A146KFI8_9EUKA|eukprot:JAP94395.1 Hypothetical protein TPC1_12966 [Trepomonas sp. PC1]
MTDEFIYKWLHTNGAKKGMWAELGEQLGVTANRAHNYYHNTWSKKFFVDAEKYKKFVYEIMDGLYDPDKPIPQLIQQTKEKFCEMFKEVSFHSGYLLQLIYRISYQITNKKRHTEEKHVDEMPQPQIAQPIQIEDFKKYLKFGK